MTLRVQQPTNFSPVEWDRQLFRDWKVTLEHLDPDQRVYTSLRVLALAMSKDRDLLAQAMAQMTENPLARGAYLLGLLELGRYTEVMLREEDVHPVDVDPISVFDAANANLAIALSAGALGRNEDAIRHMHTAQALYAALGMERRRQLLNFETERIRLDMGTASPQRIMATMAEVELGERRREFSQHILAEAYMIYGEYETAELIAPPGSGLGTFAEVLRGCPVSIFPDDDYGAMARALCDTTAEFPTPLHSPEKGYAHLLKVLRLIKVGQQGQPQAYQLLGSFHPKAPDQKVWWGLMMMAIAPGVPAARRQLDQAIAMIEEGRAGLTKQVPMLVFLAAHAPFLLVLYAAMPNSSAEVVAGAVAQPLWTGNAVFWKGNALIMGGGETGSFQLADDLRGVRSPARHPQELTRFRKSRDKTLEMTGPATAISWLLKTMVLTAHYTQTNQTYWRDKAAQLLPLLQGDEAQKAAQEVMLQDCAVLGLGSKITL